MVLNQEPLLGECSLKMGRTSSSSSLDNFSSRWFAVLLRYNIVYICCKWRYIMFCHMWCKQQKSGSECKNAKKSIFNILHFHIMFTSICTGIYVPVPPLLASHVWLFPPTFSASSAGHWTRDMHKNMWKINKQLMQVVVFNSIKSSNYLKNVEKHSNYVE